MKLIPEQYNVFNPVVLVVGLLFITACGYAVVLPGVSGPPILWLLLGIPAVLSAVGTIIVIKQLQARQKRKT